MRLKMNFIQFFCYLLGLRSGNLHFSKGWVTERKFQMEEGVTHEPLLVSEN